MISHHMRKYTKNCYASDEKYYPFFVETELTSGTSDLFSSLTFLLVLFKLRVNLLKQKQAYT